MGVREHLYRVKRKHGVFILFSNVLFGGKRTIHLARSWILKAWD